ncbi:MAG: NAD(P)/FAD-dependent oxidoreductase [Rhodospirillaceae bacterium]
MISSSTFQALMTLTAPHTAHAPAVQGNLLFETGPDRPEWSAMPPGRHRVDLCVVGGGIAGCNAALEAAQAGLSVLVIEAGRIGQGASGRNGGQVQAGFAADMDALEGQQDRQSCTDLFALTRTAVQQLRDRIAQYDIQCGLRDGILSAATKPRHLRDLDGMISEWASYGHDRLERLDQAQMHRAVDVPRYLGGVRDPEACHLNPYAYVLGLARAAEQAGAQLHEQTAMTGFEDQAGGGVLIKTRRKAASAADGKGQEGADIQATYLILAGNAHLWGAGSGAPSLIERMIMPVGTYQIATAPLGLERAKALIPGGEAVADLQFVLNYYRIDPKGRMLWGGGVSYSRMDPPRLAVTLRKEMLRWMPQLADVPVTHAWGGHVAITINRLPHLGRIGPGVLFVQGWSGHGVALSGLGGSLAARAVLATLGREDGSGAAAFDLLGRIKHMPFPGGRAMRTPILVAAMAWRRLLDLI